MTGKYQAYPEYKDSGVEWLGDTPVHWKAKQLKFLCTYNDEALPDSTSKDYELEYVDIGSVSATEGISKTETMLFEKAPSRARRVVRDGDVIISTVRTYLEAIAAIDNPPENLIVSTGFAVIRPNQYLHKGYAAYCLRANGFIKEVVARSVGVSYPAINASDLVDIKVPEPAYEEQEKIASFLDHETAKIDTLIDKQQQLIQLLKEKRQAVISHAVTKGLNPSAPMRDSGVEWLGEVPEHWKVAKVKYFATVQGGYAFNSDTYRDNGVQLLRIGNVYLNRLALERQPTFVDEQFVNMHPHFVIRKGDILMSLTGTLGKTDYGYAVHVDEKGPFMLNQRVAKIMPRGSKIAADYLIYAIRSDSYLTQLYSLPSGTKQANLSNDDVINIPIVVPPTIEEQLLVAQYISDALGKYDYLISKSEAAISLIQERRTALISAAVTGKIDVRHHVSRPAGNDTSEVSA